MSHVYLSLLAQKGPRIPNTPLLSLSVKEEQSPPFLAQIEIPDHFPPSSGLYSDTLYPFSGTWKTLWL